MYRALAAWKNIGWQKSNQLDSSFSSCKGCRRDLNTILVSYRQSRGQKIEIQTCCEIMPLLFFAPNFSLLQYLKNNASSWPRDHQTYEEACQEYGVNSYCDSTCCVGRHPNTKHSPSLDSSFAFFILSMELSLAEYFASKILHQSAEKVCPARSIKQASGMKVEH